EGRVWKPSTSSPSAAGDAPAFRDVNLGPGCDPGSPYWASGILTNLPCAFALNATVDWGALPTLAGFSGFHGILTATGGGGTSNFGQDTGAAPGINNCIGGSGITSGDGTAGSQPNGTAAMQPVTINWEYWWDSGPRLKCRPNSPCSGTSSIVARAN